MPKIIAIDCQYKVHIQKRKAGGNSNSNAGSNNSNAGSNNSNAGSSNNNAGSSNSKNVVKTADLHVRFSSSTKGSAMNATKAANNNNYNNILQDEYVLPPKPCTANSVSNTRQRPCYKLREDRYSPWEKSVTVADRDELLLSMDAKIATKNFIKKLKKEVVPPVSAYTTNSKTKHNNTYDHQAAAAATITTTTSTARIRTPISSGPVTGYFNQSTKVGIHDTHWVMPLSADDAPTAHWAKPENNRKNLLIAMNVVGNLNTARVSSRNHEYIQKFDGATRLDSHSLDIKDA